MNEIIFNTLEVVGLILLIIAVFYEFIGKSLFDKESKK
jgi:hypothetical protein